MPVLTSTYPGAPWWQFNGHIQTIAPAFRKLKPLPWRRERLELADGDFLDLDWLDTSTEHLVILSHGLEGHSRRPYMVGMAMAFRQKGWSVLAWNCRSCSGEMNRLPRLYHHGDVEDIGAVVAHALQTHPWRIVVLVGFSMGGAMTMKYLGVQGRQLHPAIRMGIGFSVPCDLEAGAQALDAPANVLYRKRFLKALRKKIEFKNQQHHLGLDLHRFRQIRHWRDFGEWFSAPLNGYRDASAFYYASSCRHFIATTAVPLYIINADNDPILTSACTPTTLARQHPLIFVEQPAEGGHVGFSLSRSVHTWAEIRAVTLAETCVRRESLRLSSNLDR